MIFFKQEKKNNENMCKMITLKTKIEECIVYVCMPFKTRKALVALYSLLFCLS